MIRSDVSKELERGDGFPGMVNPGGGWRRLKAKMIRITDLRNITSPY
jgi:hypothetical protein